MVESIARISLVTSILVFLGGTLVLCACPGVFAVAAVLAAVSAKWGNANVRYFGWLWVIASLIMTSIHLFAELRG